MKKTGLIIGSIEIIVGLLALMATSVITQVIPKMARIQFMSTSGTFTEVDYTPNFTFANGLAVILCLLGVLTILYFVFMQKEH